jgi:hypothetical protein
LLNLFFKTKVKMAKRSKRHHVRRRRRVGAASGMAGLLQKAGGVVAGVFAGGMLVKMLPASITPTIQGAVLLGGGAFLASKAKSPLIEGVGYGLAAKGANSLLVSFGAITGIGSVPMIGYRNTPKIQNAVAGTMSAEFNRNVSGSGGIMKNPIGGIKDLAAIGALYDN